MDGFISTQKFLGFCRILVCFNYNYLRLISLLSRTPDTIRVFLPALLPSFLFLQMKECSPLQLYYFLQPHPLYHIHKHLSVGSLSLCALWSPIFHVTSSTLGFPMRPAPAALRTCLHLPHLSLPPAGIVGAALFAQTSLPAHEHLRRLRGFLFGMN